MLCVRVCAGVRGSVHACAGTWKRFRWVSVFVLGLAREGI